MSENSARIIEKDIFASSGLAPSESGDSEIIDLFGEAGRTSKLSCQAIYTVGSAPGGKAFDSPEVADLTNQGLTYTAVESGAAGNDISIEIIDNGMPGQNLEVAVVDDAISITLENSAGVAASLVNQGLTYTAQDAGAEGNDISVALIATGVPGQPLEVNVVGDAISVNLEYSDGVKASLTDQDLTYTALDIGSTGNDISIELIDTGIPGQNLEVDVVGDAISVKLEYSDGTKASLVDQGLTYTAQEIGPGGNNITVALLDTTAGQDLAVNVVGDAISVDLETSDGVHSSAVVQDITYTAIDPGTYGDEITVTYVNPGVPDQPLDAYASFPEVYVSLATSPETYASLVVQDVLYEALEVGAIGNTIQFQYFGGGTAGSEGVLVIGGGVDPLVIQVALQIGVSTATNLMNAINGNPVASTLVTASISGNPLTTQTIYGPTAMAGGADSQIISTADEIVTAVDAYQSGSPFVVLEVTGTGSNIQTEASDVLSGGENPAVVSTADDVRDAINADIDASALVVVSGAGSDPLVALSETNLSGGENAAVVSTADDVKAAVNADADASGLVLVSGAGSDPLVALSETSLSGGENSAIVSTANDVKAAVNGDVDASMLVVVAGAGAVPLVALVSTHLAGGEDSGVVSTANDVKAAVNADVDASALVVVTGAGATPLSALSATNLSGGVDGDVDVPGSAFYIPAHGFVTGLKVRLTTTGTLPAPLLVATDYYVIVLDADTIQLASSEANALAGTFIVLTNAGTGMGIISPTSGTGFVTFQMSNNAVVWADIQPATSISGTGTVVLSQPSAAYRYFKAVKTVSSGQFELQALLLVIGPAV